MQDRINKETITNWWQNARERGANYVSLYVPNKKTNKYYLYAREHGNPRQISTICLHTTDRFTAASYKRFVDAANDTDDIDSVIEYILNYKLEEVDKEDSPHKKESRLNTIETYKYRIKDLREFCKSHKITGFNQLYDEETIEAFIEFVKHRHPNKYASAERAIAAAFHFMRRWKINIPNNVNYVMKGYRRHLTHYREDDKDFLTTEELDKIVDYAHYSPEERVLVLLHTYSGIHDLGASRLIWSDFQANGTNFRLQVYDKDGARRFAPCPTPLASALITLRQERNNPKADDRVLLAYNSYDKRLRFIKRVIEETTGHKGASTLLRRSACNALENANYGAGTRFLGHANRRTTVKNYINNNDFSSIDRLFGEDGKFSGTCSGSIGFSPVFQATLDRTGATSVKFVDSINQPPVNDMAVNIEGQCRRFVPHKVFDKIDGGPPQQEIRAKGVSQFVMKDSFGVGDSRISNDDL